ncbi:putative LRR receptor-like serine/threonine-protein kinase HSL2 [Cocos nucifera]|uniref:non-specific serine/threonine protein kinase n=1 Tax=Cocos nucifera TaxID=13894 RepID=A0A8K0IAJ9_COCNU|nr:putative LRR receptor-like serine/threonine-protein kinase HSL2 [Cocos nucifera]
MLTTTIPLLFLLPLLFHASLALNQEGLLLLRAKRGLDDPLNSLSDWDPRDPTPCNWTGVSCRPSSGGGAATVYAVSLPALGLSGPFPSALCLLPNLSVLSLALNSINSSLPSSSLLPCSSLSHLDLSENLLVGPLPTSLPLLPFLSYLDLSSNNFSGDIPPSFATFPRLQTLSLVYNLLSGPLPHFLSNLSSLQELNLSYNPFSPSPLPHSFADLASLRVLWLAGCNLVGRILPAIGRLANLIDLDLSYNSLDGTIPASLAGLSSVVQIELYSNSLSGPIPGGLSNLTNLRFFDASMNQLSGPIPEDIFLAPELENLNLYENNLTGPIPSTISRCRNIADIRLFSNRLSGPLPADFGKNFPLVFIDISDNSFSGEIPAGICAQGKLEQLLLLNNLFSGSIPDTLGRCRMLTRVRLKNNRLSGDVPDALWGLPHVYLLELAGNFLSGGISPAISGAGNLSQLLISDNQFSGPIPVEIGALSNLSAFSAANNRLTGPLPASLGSLAQLWKIDLHNNSLSGELPAGIQSWRKLSQLNLADNYFTGGIPPQLGNLPVLNYLDLSGNALTGAIPTQLQNLKLNQLNLSNNKLSGAIPPLFLSGAYKNSFLGNPGLCNDLTKLCRSHHNATEKHHGFVWLLRAIFILSSVIFVAGVAWSYRKYRDYRKGNLGLDKSKWILTSFYKLGFSEYEVLDCLDEDNVIGRGASGKVYKAVLCNGETVAVKKLWCMPKKENDDTDQSPDHGFEAEIELYSNSLSGPIPGGLSNLTNLRFFDASMNQLSGPIPEDIFLAPELENLNLYENNLTGPIPSTISRCRNIADIRLFSNRLSGPLPADFGKNFPLVFIDISDNSFSGEIPAGICAQGKLEQLLLLNNLFSGSIPDTLGRCRMLTRVRLKNNRLSGDVPDALWGLPHVYLLELAGNFLSGGISPAISGAGNLSQLLISDNQFSGPIPVEIGALSNLSAFSAANNRLTGPLPASLGSLAQLWKIDLHNNSLSGELPAGIQSWRKLSQLNLADNYFTGGIPPQLGNLPVLNYLDLSGNALTGAIPTQLQNLKLNQLNLSNNKLSGAIPPLFLSGAYKNSFLGNPGLCNDLTKLCRSHHNATEKHHGFVWLLRAIFILSSVIFVAGVAWSYRKYRDYRKGNLGLDKSKWILTSFYKLGFSEYEVLDCLDEDNVIGRGASGKVYKAVLCNGETVAVKKLWCMPKKENDDTDQSPDHGFEAEVTTLGKIRHKNIVKLWCCCDHKDCKLLVYEYMPNGSLGDLLHSNKGGLLDWPIRYKIALDSAEGLSYLHHDCVPPIVHRDVKSNNILLDGEFGAKVSDFGVAKTIGKGSKSMSAIAGSCGYIAPGRFSFQIIIFDSPFATEYAYTLRVNEKSDIYSFGVVILELVTGKLPVDPEFGEKDLVKWVCSIMEQKGVDHVIDPKLSICFRDEICRVLNIGLLCTSALPINRPSMRQVVKMLLGVRPEEKTKPKPVMKDGKPSPYYHQGNSDQGCIV